MTQRFIKESGIDLAAIEALEPTKKLGPYLVNYPFGGSRREGQVELSKSDEGKMGVRVFGENGPDGQWFVRWGGVTAGEIYEQLLSDDFQVTGGEKRHLQSDYEPTGIRVAGGLSGEGDRQKAAGRFIYNLSLVLMNNVEQFNVVTSAVVFGVGSGLIRL